MADNPIKYNSRTFSTILNDINSDAELSSKPNWWKRLWAGIGDVLSIWVNSVANLLFLRTSYTRGAVADLCALIDYTLTPHTTSSGYLLFYVSTSVGSAIFPFTVSAANLTANSPGSVGISFRRYASRASATFTLVQPVLTVGTPPAHLFTVAVDLVYTGHKVRLTTSGTLPAPLQINRDYFVIYFSGTSIALAETLADAYAGNYITYTSAGSGTQTATVYSKAVAVYQQNDLASSVTIGASDGITEWQEFNLPDTFVLTSTIIVTINSIAWTAVTTFVDSGSTSKIFKVIPLSDNQFSIRFGDGTYGMIPPAADIFVQYSYGGGSSSNVTTLNRITAYSGSDANVNGVSNCTTFTGGDDAQDIESAKRLAPTLLKTRDRFVTEADGLALAEAYGGLSLVAAIANYYGLLSCKVVGIADGGGNPSTPLKSAVQQYLIDRSVMGSMDVCFVNCTLTTHNVTSSVKLLTGYSWANISPYISLAFKLFFSETGTEIQTAYIGLGIAKAVVKINTIFSTAFTATDYTQISRLLDNLVPRNFGDSIQASDALGFIDAFVIGVDYLTIAAPSFPITNASDEISTSGSVSLTQL